MFPMVAFAHGDDDCTTAEITTHKQFSWAFWRGSVVRTYLTFTNHCPHDVFVKWKEFENGVGTSDVLGMDIDPNDTYIRFMAVGWAKDGVPIYSIVWCYHYSDFRVFQSHGGKRCDPYLHENILHSGD